MIAAARATVEPVMSYHDDWLVNVLLSDGRVYTFVTELWPEHEGGRPNTPDEAATNWPRVVRRAQQEAVRLAEHDAPTWGLDAIPDTHEQFRRAMDFVCQHTSDANFARYLLR